MEISNYIVYLWLFPVVLQIILPLVTLCGWMVMKLPAILLGFMRPITHGVKKPVFAG